MADNKKYVQSDAVKQAQAALQQQQAQKPGAYQSQWQQTLNDTISKIQNREKFSYDLNGDALYQQYKDRYIQQGQQAMMDTMGQAATLTGGYGNSYAQSVGQQTYQGYLQGLNDKIPELYNLALQQYQTEGDNLMNQYGLLADRDNTDYGRYRDQVGDYNTQLDILMNQYNNERSFDYGQYRDATGDAQWQAEFDEAKRQYEQQWAASQAKSSGGSGGGSGGGGGSEEVKELQRQLNALGANLDVDGIRGPQTEAAIAKYMGGDDPGAPSYTLKEMLDTMISTGQTSSGQKVDTSTRSGQQSLKRDIEREIAMAEAEGEISAAEADNLRQIYTPRGYTY